MRLIPAEDVIRFQLAEERELLVARAPFALCLLLSVPAMAQLNDSGQVVCYDASTATGTVSPGTPAPEASGFEEQDCTRGRAAMDALGRLPKQGSSSAPGRDYTKVANDGSALSAAATLGPGPTNWRCTYDHTSGLMWEIKTADGGLYDMDHFYTWFDPDFSRNGGNSGTAGGNATCGGTLANCNTSTYLATVNAQSGANRLCGRLGWRLPKSVELQSLAHYAGSAGLAIDGSFFANTGSTGFFSNTGSSGYWAAESYAADATSARVVGFAAGNIYASSKSSLQRLRLVRAETWVSSS